MTRKVIKWKQITMKTSTRANLHWRRYLGSHHFARFLQISSKLQILPWVQIFSRLSFLPSSIHSYFTHSTYIWHDMVKRGRKRDGEKLSIVRNEEKKIGLARMIHKIALDCFFLSISIPKNQLMLFFLGYYPPRNYHNWVRDICWWNGSKKSKSLF